MSAATGVCCSVKIGLMQEVLLPCVVDDWLYKSKRNELSIEFVENAMRSSRSLGSENCTQRLHHFVIEIQLVSLI